MLGTRPRVRRLRVLMTVLALLAATLAAADGGGTPAAAADATLIDFEESIPTAGNITSQYCNSATTNKGVKFLEPVRLIEPAVGTMTPTHAATNHFTGDEFTEPNVMRISFTADQSFVSVRVGLDQNYNFPVTAQLRAYTTPIPSPSSQLTDGEDHVLLDDEATTINQQLYLTSGGAAQPIRSIEIEFVGPDPVNAAFEVIDNLLYSTLGPQCVSDTTDPVVQIFKPALETPFYGSPSGGDVPLSIHFRATDAGTGVASVEVEFLDFGTTVLDSFWVCGGANAPGCSIPSTTVERNFLSFMPAGTGTLRITAHDFAGNEDFATRAVTVTPSSANLWARGLEITQATQPWVATNPSTRRATALGPPTYAYPAIPESVPLVAGRSTVARLYVGVENTIGGAALPGVEAALRCYSEPSYTVSCPGPSEIYPEHQPPNTTKAVTIDPDHTMTDQREQSTRTLNFVLPDDWTAVGVIHLEASVTPPVPECPDCTDAANTIRVRSIPFREVPNWHTVVRQVLTERGILGRATDAQREAVVDYIRRIYPVDESTVMNGFHILPYIWLDITGAGPDCSEFLGDLRSIYDYLLDDHGYKAVWALTDSQAPHWCSGLGNAGGVAVSRGDDVTGGAHEIGHALGLLHPGPPGETHGSECKKDAYCDTDWPWPHGGTGTFGFDVLRFEAHDPGNPPDDPHENDFMSYGSPEWISPRNWIRIFNALAGWSFPYPKATTGTAAAAYSLAAEPPTPAPHLLVRGRFDPDTSQWQLLPIYEVDRVPVPPEPEAPDLLVELADGSGTVLVTQRIDLPDNDHIDTDDPNVIEVPDPSFVRFIEMPAGTEQVALREGGTMLATRFRSSQAPAVAIVTPTAAGFDGSIRWTWSDGDSDPLSALVEYRHTSEAPWQPLGIDLVDDVFTVDPALLPGGPTAQLRLSVTDGFNTTSVLSEHFAVADTSPAVEILRPADADVFEAGRRIVLSGNAADREDEALAGTALAWSSDLDGNLGTGGTLEVDGLSAGTHAVTLVGTDTAGNTDTAAVVIHVEAPPVINHQPVADAGPDQGWSSTGTALLDGTGSHDPDGDPLTFHWSLVSAPEGALALFDDPNVPQPTLFTAMSGTYEIDLVVHDGTVGSRSDRVVVHRDLVAPQLDIEVPEFGVAVQDGVVWTATAVDQTSGIAALWFTLRADDGHTGTPIGLERLDAMYDVATDRWIHAFDTTDVPDGYYLILASADDVAGNRGSSEVVRFSVRNWAVVEMLPATPNHNAGRTVPVKFSVEVAAAVDPAMPFVYNEELTVLIYETEEPGDVLHTATFGTGSWHYRINEAAGFYITNFKTLRHRTEYTVEINRGDFEIGRFTFATVRGKPK